MREASSRRTEQTEIYHGRRDTAGHRRAAAARGPHHLGHEIPLQGPGRHADRPDHGRHARARRQIPGRERHRSDDVHRRHARLEVPAGRPDSRRRRYRAERHAHQLLRAGPDRRQPLRHLRRPQGRRHDHAGRRRHRPRLLDLASEGSPRLSRRRRRFGARSPS